MIQIVVISKLKADREKIGAVLSDQKDLKIVGLGSSEYDALKYAMDLHPALEILDLEQNDDANLELVRLIKRKSPSTALIVISPRYKSGNAGRVFEAGVSGYLIKKTDLDRLADSARTVSSGGYYFSSPIMEEVFNFLLEAERIPNLRKYLVLAQEGYKTIPANISRMERQIMSLIARGISVKEIAGDLHLVPGTVRNYLSSAMHKTNIKDRAQVVIYAFVHGLIDFKFDKPSRGISRFGPGDRPGSEEISF
jgi:DNA-binding NarL/FixJ family response regulator